MKLDDFFIGLTFYTASGAWRCTDVGTRVVCAISLGPHEIITSRGGERVREITSDPSWLAGPPYAIPEVVFNEYDQEGCYLEPLS